MVISWVNYLDILNHLFSTEHDDFLDEANSILLNDVTRGIPVVNLIQVREKKLGFPYSGRILFNYYPIAYTLY